MIGLPRFFVPVDEISQDRIEITGADARHISKVLRMRIGDELTVCDGHGWDYQCCIGEFLNDRVLLEVCSKALCRAEPDVQITLYMAIPKGDKLDYVIQKSVELGVHRIMPFHAARCVAKVHAKDADRKRERWQRIAYEAAKQCGRGLIPEVGGPIGFEEMLESARGSQLPLFFYECEEDNGLKTILNRAGKFDTASIVIGPEGGFSLDEVDRARVAGMQSASLGKRILRCETAPGCALAAILYHTDNL